VKVRTLVIGEAGLLDRGKAKMQAIGAIMRKLVHLAFGILKSQQPFDPNYSIATP
jgi:transposase